MAAERSALLLVGHDDSLDEDDLERQEEDLPEYLLEESGTDTEQEEEGEDRTSVDLCSPREGRTSVGGDMWYVRESSNGEQREGGVTAGVPPLLEACDQAPEQPVSWSVQGSVGVTHGPTASPCAHEQVHALEKELQSLTVLYRTRGKKVEELSCALEAAEAEVERCERVQSHHRGQVEEQCVGLKKELEQLRTTATQMAEENALLSRQLEEVRQVAVLLEQDRDEVQRQLQSSESTISSLQHQLEEVVGGDTLRQLRAQQEAALAAVNERHEVEVLRLQQELDLLKERTEGEGEGQNSLMPPSFLVRPLLAEGSAYCDLVAECEDLRSAVSHAAEEREALSEELEAARTAGLQQQTLVSQLEVEASGLRKELEDAEGRWREERARLEKERKGALEECRTQCLQLHDQSASRLNKAFEAEKRFLVDNCQRQTTALRAELKAVQDECSSLSAQLADRQGVPQHSCCQVAVQTDPPHVSGLAEEAEFESRVEAEVEAARVAWRDGLLDSTESAVNKALQKVEMEFALRLEREKVAVEERVRLEWVRDKQEALTRLAKELGSRAGREMRLSVAVQTVGSWEGVVREAVQHAQEQWEEVRGRGEAALRVELEQRREVELKEAVQRVLERAKTHYDGVVARVRSKLVTEQRRVAEQQAAEREALLQQLQETRDQLHLEQLWRKEVEMDVHSLQPKLRRDLATWMEQVLDRRRQHKRECAIEVH